MKRLLTIILITVVLFTACASNVDVDVMSRPSNPYLNVNGNGEFYADDSRRILYFDFGSMQSALVCSRPNCKHDDPEVCSAYGMRSHPTIVDGKLYFFEYEINWDNGEVNTGTTVWRADTDGSGRTKIDVLKGIRVDYIDSMFIKGSTAYFIAVEVEFDPKTLNSTDHSKRYLCSYNFNKRKFKNYGLLCEGYSAGADLFGEYDGKLYISCGYTEEQVDLSADDWAERLTEAGINIYLCFDLETKEISPAELPEAVFIGDGFYGYNDGDNIVVLNSEGNKMTVEGLNMPMTIVSIPINGYIFDTTAKLALDLNSGEVKLLSSEIKINDIVVAYSGGGYIVKGQPDLEYRKISEEDIFTDEISSEPEWRSFTDHPESIAYQNMTAKEKQEKEKADYEKYYELLGISEHVPEKTVGALVSSITYKFWQEYRCAVYDCASYYYLGSVVDTDYEAPCSVEITYVEVNPFTGESLEGSELFENNEGECGIAAVVFPDEGFYFKKFSISQHFSTVNYPTFAEIKDKEFYSDFGLEVPEP